MDDPLSLFHPLVAEWFRTRVGEPTDVQAAAWPRIAAGEHVLVTAPTGTGKTLTAFLHALNQLITGHYPTGRCSVLYISPLKALNNDIQRNLLGPLTELREVFGEAEEDFPRLRVLTRSGDTPAEDRRQMQRRPPEILITTPESLNLLLSSRGGLSILDSLQTVILDEIHAVVDSKRGVHLMSGVERLVRLSGEFQRVALSATVRPLELVAQVVGGFERCEGDRYEPRRVAIIRGGGRKAYDVRVRFPAAMEKEFGGGTHWTPVVRESKRIVSRNRSTLVFTNSRRLAEGITWEMNLDEKGFLAYAHHGSLSREIRTEVERRLKAGDLRAIVATNSLEMGIDIGSLDEVVLIQSPPRISSAIQRVGRAGHQVGETSRATLLASHSHDLLEGAVLARSILDQNIEATHAIQGALDVLAQTLISMAGLETWDADELFAEVRRSYPFHSITRQQFDLVLDMLAGRYEETRVRELTARLSVDRIGNTVAARPGALQDIYFSGGTIPDRGYYHLRHLKTNALIGELDEEFVWEAEPGQTMAFGAQGWRIERITHNDVFVVPTGRKSEGMAPFWRGEEWGRDAHFSDLIGRFLEEADEALDTPEFAAGLRERHCLDATASEALVEYLRHQKAQCDGHLPHRHHVVVEHVQAGPGDHPGNQIVIHTFWGGTVNRPFAMALSAAWEQRFGSKPEIYPSNDAVALPLASEVTGEELLSLVTPETLEGLLRRSLEGSGFFGARFRECAGRALLITRSRMNRRMPLWVNRLRSKRLLQAVLRYEDFPILLEAWRSCLQDEFDLPALQQRLAELQAGIITWSETRHEHASPFAQALSWQQINRYMYADDTLAGSVESRLRGDLLQEVVFSPTLRPTVTPELVSQFEAKRRRVAPGYSPQSARDLLDWVKERTLVPAGEWEELLAAMERDHGLKAQELLAELPGRLVTLWPTGCEAELVAAAEDLRRVGALWRGELEIRAIGEHGRGPHPAPRDTRGSADDAREDERLTQVLGEWLRFYGPRSPEFIATTLGLAPDRLTLALQDLVDAQTVVQGLLVEGGREADVCDAENFETLLRMARAAQVPSLQPRPASELALFLGHWQGLCRPGETTQDLFARVQQLSGHEIRAELWEKVILPARQRQYRLAHLDALMQEGHLVWIGAAGRKVAFCLPEDLDLVLPRHRVAQAQGITELFPDPEARYTLRGLLTRSGLGVEELTNSLWEAVWQGVLSNDTMAVLRRGIACDFKPLPLPPEEELHQRGRRLGVPRRTLGRAGGGLSYVGNWFRLPEVEADDDLLDEEERGKDRARLLLERYGVLFRELLDHEPRQFRWPAVFRALRLMELSGEVIGGCFFEGVQGLQFASPAALRQLQQGLQGDFVWWVNACDPASLCGVPLQGLRRELPRRVPGNFVVYSGAEVMLVVENMGKRLQFSIAPDDPRLPASLAPLHELLEREFEPLHRIMVETINGERAVESEYREAICAGFDALREAGALVLRRALGA